MARLARKTPARRAPAKPVAPRPAPKPDTARKIHVLKCWTESFEAILSGAKTGEIRINDRNYQPGDDIVMREYKLGSGTTLSHYTGRELRVRIDYLYSESQVLRKDPFGLDSGGVEMFVLMSIKLYPDSLRTE